MEEAVKQSRMAFHAKVIFLFVAFAVYVGLELSLNVLLIDLYALPVEKVFVEHAESVARLDLFGRSLSSFGLALAIYTFLPRKLKSRFKFQSQTIDTVHPQHISTTQRIRLFIISIANAGITILSIIVIWLLLIPSIRVGIESWVHSRTGEQKLSAVRAIVYKEGYLAGRIKIADFDEFNAIVQDEDRRDLVVALIPSLAYFSKNFNQMIEQNMEKLADAFLSNNQTQRFTQNGLPKLRQFDDLYRQELQLYHKANSDYQKAIHRLENDNAILNEQRELIASVNTQLQSRWDTYAQLYGSARSSFKQLSKDKSLRKAHHKFKDQHRARGCNTACKRRVEEAHADYLNSITYQNGQGLGIKVLPEHVIFTVLGTEERILSMLRQGREHWLKLVYGVGEHEKFDEFVVSEEARVQLIKMFKEKGVELPSNWQTHDVNAITKILRDKYEQQANQVWQKYQRDSRFDITDVGLDRIGFATHDTIKRMAQQTLGQYYINDFSPGLSETTYEKKWLAEQDNISFIRMITSTAAAAAFAPGGSLYDIGNDAVKLAVILPFSVVLSFVAICALFFKFGYYLYHNSVTYLVALVTMGVLIIGLPVINSVSKEGTYGEMMSAFAEDFNKNEPLEYTKTTLFGFVLDVENGIFEKYRGLSFINHIASQIFNQYREDPATGELVVRKPKNDFFKVMNRYDDVFFEHFSWLPSAVAPSFFGMSEVRQYDANITVLKRDHSIGAFLGVYLNNDKVTRVAMPNFLANKDLGLLAEQRFFYNPDLTSIANTFIGSYEDGDYLLNLANGTVMRESAKNKIEKAMVKLINKQPGLLNSLNKLQASGLKNLVLVQLNRSENYQCFSVPTINSVSFAKAIAEQSLSFQPIDNCRGVL
ncbi:hypothetical protein [Thalassotalea fusca]